MIFTGLTRALEGEKICSFLVSIDRRKKKAEVLITSLQVPADAIILQYSKVIRAIEMRDVVNVVLRPYDRLLDPLPG